MGKNHIIIKSNINQIALSDEFNWSHEIKDNEIKIVEIGSQAINSSIKNKLNKNVNYIGVDICKGENVDIVLEDPYKLPFENNSIILPPISIIVPSPSLYLQYLTTGNSKILL